ncbi:MAG: cob(I)yrinic acid a,c-diamide adenosyltransferase [Gammaproteobacteria bacterium]|nr:MAG: cob(I)yrinic acid a,c-diamide adenosyltransferase [Gammaproteobacteria bacterium]
MGHRLSKIYTRTGDDGTTGLGDGTRTGKDSLRVEAYGTVDELNSVIGLLLTHKLPEHMRACLTDVQHTLFDLGGELCIPGHGAVDPARVTELELTLDELNAGLQPLKEFILPGGTPVAALCHLARTVCRRAERRIVSLARSETVSATAIRYLNRLSDLLFVTARALNAQAGEPDILWRREQKPTDA